MAIQDVQLLEESRNRYLTYALSVVSGRAIPDVRDGLKPVQRRILYAMMNNLSLYPDRQHRKSAAVVGEVLARFHPHGDSACYEAMVRMAQDFSLRYPLVDGQGNFGSLDGDAAAAYRYTEARLTPLALEVVGDIGEDTIAERDNFDQTVKEPVVLPSRVPNLLINGAAGIAVGLATAIPPHNLNEVIKALILLLEDPEANDAKLLTAIKGPDFPTGCMVLNSRAELKSIYGTGRGAIRMRADYVVEDEKRGKRQIVVTSIPYGIDKSALIEKIADLIVSRKVPQLSDVRDESTDVVRIVLELAKDAEADKAMAYLFKHTPLESSFNVNLTALVPTANPYAGRPALLSLREMLQQFINFRVDVTRRKLAHERRHLEARIHLLEGLMIVCDHLTEVLQIVRKSEGRSDAALKLQKRFKLSEAQSFFIVDLRIYQLSKTSVDDVAAELKEKRSRVAEIDRILGNKKALTKVLIQDFERISEQYGDKRRSKIVSDFEELEFDKEAYVQHEDVWVIVTGDGWLKRIKQSNDPATTRIREGDTLFYTNQASTRDSLALFTNMGNVFVTRVMDIVSTSGFGDPVQKMFKFQDGEVVRAVDLIRRFDDAAATDEFEIILYSRRGLGLRLGGDVLTDTKKIGKRLMKLAEGDELSGVVRVRGSLVVLVSAQGYALSFLRDEVPLLAGAGKGVLLQRLPTEDALVAVASGERKGIVKLQLTNKNDLELQFSSLTITTRAKRGLKVVKKGLPVVGVRQSESTQ